MCEERIQAWAALHTRSYLSRSELQISVKITTQTRPISGESRSPPHISFSNSVQPAMERTVSPHNSHVAVLATGSQKVTVFGDGVFKD